ncbi:MAG: hypothetical protein ACYC3K_16235 [Candidatus Nanopelagicales bacterium]
MSEGLDALWEAWAEALPSVISELGMDWENATELDSRHRLS